MMASSLTQKGQATIPAPIRKELELEPGDKIAFEKVGSNVIIRKIQRFDPADHQALAGTLSEWGSPEDDEAYRDL